MSAEVNVCVDFSVRVDFSLCFSIRCLRELACKTVEI